MIRELFDIFGVKKSGINLFFKVFTGEFLKRIFLRKGVSLEKKIVFFPLEPNSVSVRIFGILFLTSTSSGIMDKKITHT